MPQFSYNDPLPAGRNGQCADVSYYRDVLTLINSNPQAAQVSTVTVSGASNSTLYQIIVNGVTLSYTSDVAATQQEIADGLVAAINVEPAISGLARALSAVNSFTVTSRLPGLGGALTISEDSAQLSVAVTTTPANASPVPFGRCVVRTADREGRLVADADFAGANGQFSFTASNSQIYTINLVVSGVTYPAIFTADGSATALEIATGLAAAVSALTVGLTGSVVATDQLLVQADDGIVFTIGTLSAGTGAITRVSYNGGARPVELFVAELTDSFDSSEMASSGLADGLAGYPGNRSMNGARKGRYIVPVEESIATGDPVFVRVAINGSLSQIGAFRKSANAGCVRIDTLYPSISWHAPISSSQAKIQLG
jgi:hypothetical protein